MICPVDSVEECTFFCGIITPSWFANPDCVAGLERAVALRKPILLCVQEGVKLAAMVEKLADKIVYWRLPSDVRAAVEEFERRLNDADIN